VLATDSGHKLEHLVAVSLAPAILPNKIDWLGSSLYANHKSFIWTLFSYLFTDMIARQVGVRVIATEWTSIHHDEIRELP
jgi:hypothetical protein